MKPSWIRPVLSFTKMLPILEYHERMMVVGYERGDIDFTDAHRRAYLDVLDANGWGEAAFDKELLRRIDAGWDIKTPPPRGDQPMAIPASREASPGFARCVFGLA